MQLPRIIARHDRTVTITPNCERQPLDIEVHGLFAELLVDKKETPLNAEAFRGALVAGARNTRTPTFTLAA